LFYLVGGNGNPLPPGVPTLDAGAEGGALLGSFLVYDQLTPYIPHIHTYSHFFCSALEHVSP
jgi:hypothetical protein